jgi:hypothetical protein
MEIRAVAMANQQHCAQLFKHASSVLAGVGPSGWPFGHFIFLSLSWAVAPDTEIETSTPWLAGLSARSVK